MKNSPLELTQLLLPWLNSIALWRNSPDGDEMLWLACLVAGGEGESFSLLPVSRASGSADVCIKCADVVEAPGNIGAAGEGSAPFLFQSKRS